METTEESGQRTEERISRPETDERPSQEHSQETMHMTRKDQQLEPKLEPALETRELLSKGAEYAADSDSPMKPQGELDVNTEGISKMSSRF